MLIYLGGKVCPEVALLAEGVDRNPCAPPRAKRGEGSPSSRRAWIEIETKT